MPVLLQYMYFFILTLGMCNIVGVAYASNTANITEGERLYIQCTGCHAPAYHRTGPKHCGLLGRTAGQVKGFEFTPAMQQSGIVWNKKTLEQFLQAPLAMVPGTSMGIVGVPSKEERLQLVEFIMTLTKDNLLCQ